MPLSRLDLLWAAMLVTERDIWVNLAHIGNKERGFLLDDPVSPAKLFGIYVETVVEKFWGSKARSPVFKSFIPQSSRSEPKQPRGPGQSWSKDQ